MNGKDVNNRATAQIMQKGIRCKGLFGEAKVFVIQACRSSEITGDSDEVEKPLPDVPKESDVLIAYATFEGLGAYRTRAGSWFITTLLNLLTKNVHDLHLMDILTLVNRVIAEEKSTYTHLQMPSQLCSLTKFVYFRGEAINNSS